jgi:cobalt-zinc-cadmium efflux system outer membrane protein
MPLIDARMAIADARCPRATRMLMVAASVALLAFLASPARAQSERQPAAVLTLRALLDSVRHHPVNLAAESAVRAAEGARRTAGTIANPTFSYQVDQTPFPGGRPLVGMDREAMATAMVPFEFLYQRGPRLSRATAELRAAKNDADRTRQRLELDAASAYYRVALAQVQVATTRDLIGWLDTLVVYNESRVREGAAAEADLIRARLERDRMSAEEAMQEADLAQARASLASYVSDPPLAAESLIVSVNDLPFPVSVAVSPGPMNSAARRPDVRAAEQRVLASDAALASERSMVLRDVGAMIGTMQTGRMTSMVAGLSMPLPVFDQNRGEIQRASAERDAARYDLAAEQRAANADLRGALDAARLLSDRASALVHADSSSFLARADESRRIALGAYREGAVPLFQVIDAVRSWADARMSYYRIIAAQHQSVLALVAAQGRDLTDALPALRGPERNRQ